MEEKNHGHSKRGSLVGETKGQYHYGRNGEVCATVTNLKGALAHRQAVTVTLANYCRGPPNLEDDEPLSASKLPNIRPEVNVRGVPSTAPSPLRITGTARPGWRQRAAGPGEQL